MAEVVGRERHLTVTTPACIVALTLLCLAHAAQRDTFTQDALPDKFSTVLKNRNYPTLSGKLLEMSPTQFYTAPSTLPTPTASVSVPSLWEMMKLNFNQKLQPKPEESNSIFSPSSRLTSSWDWASKLGVSSDVPTSNRSTRGSPLEHAFAFDTAKIFGNMGKSLLSSLWSNAIANNGATLVATPSVNDARANHPITNFKLDVTDAVKQKVRDLAFANFRLHDNKASSFRENFLPVIKKEANVGWGWKGHHQVVVVHPEATLLERWIRAKISITHTLIHAKLRLYKTLITSTVPGLIRIQLNVINLLLNLIAQKDLTPFFRTLRILRKAVLSGKTSLLTALLELKGPDHGHGWTPQKYTTPKPDYGYEKWTTPRPDYGYEKPKPDYGYEKWTTPKPDYGYEKPKPDYGYEKWTTPKPDYGYGIPPQKWTTSKPWVDLDVIPAPNPNYGHIKNIYNEQSHPWKTLTDPIYAYPSSQVKSHETYPTLPPVVSLQPPGSFSSDSDAVVVSGKFLRDLMKQYMSLSSSAVQPSLSTPTTKSKTEDNEIPSQRQIPPDDESRRPRFSSKLLNSAFNR